MAATGNRPEHLDSSAVGERLRPSGSLLGAHIALDAAIDRRAVRPSGHDSTTLDLLVRLFLSPGRALRAVELCAQLLKSPSHISRLTDRAEAAGLVTREPDPDDRRASQIRLTDEGAEVAQAFLPDLIGVIDDAIFSVLSDEEIEALVAMLDRIEHAARADLS